MGRLLAVWAGEDVGDVREVRGVVSGVVFETGEVVGNDWLGVVVQLEDFAVLEEGFHVDVVVLDEVPQLGAARMNGRWRINAQSSREVKICMVAEGKKRRETVRRANGCEMRSAFDMPLDMGKLTWILNSLICSRLFVECA